MGGIHTRVVWEGYTTRVCTGDIHHPGYVSYLHTLGIPTTLLVRTQHVHGGISVWQRGPGLNLVNS